MKIKPLDERVLIKTVKAESKSAGGLFIPQTAQEKTQEGIVLAVGDSDKIKVAVNNRVIYDKYAGTKLEIGGEEQIVLKMADILAIIE